MKKMMNIKILSIILFVILIVFAYNYFSSMPVEADNTLMNDDDSITFSINQYDPLTDASFSFINNNYDVSINDFSFNTMDLQNMGIL
jgi:hypothetical protein